MTNESYVSGERSAALIEDTIGAFLDRVAEQDGDKLALVVPHQGVRWTYAELKTHSDTFAAGLLSLGLEPDRKSVV